MACKHKFYKDLSLGKIDFKPKILIIGTFNPEWPKENKAQWFYGRTGNNYFWDILPRMFEEEGFRTGFNSKIAKEFCSRNKVAITDLISSINDAEANNEKHLKIISEFKDNEFAKTFEDFEMTDILKILQENPTIKKIYFTRKQGIKLFDDKIIEIQRYCIKHELYFSHLTTPSKNARFQMRGYQPKNPNLKRTLPNFIYENWLEKWR